MDYNFSVMKRLGLFIILLLLFTAPVSAQVPTATQQLPTPTEEPTKMVHESGYWEYVTNATGLTISAYHGNEKAIEIPDEIYGIPVTALADNLFKSNTTVQSVYIPDSVTIIGTYAFHGCTSLTDVRLPSLLRRIESYTFRYCAALKKIDLPDHLSSIASNSFAGCISLDSIIIPDSVNDIGESAFDECTSLESVVISKNLNYVGTNAFRKTPWFDAQTDEFVIIGNNLLIKYNGSASRVDVPYGVTYIVDAFLDNPFVETIIIPNSVIRIGPSSFRGAVNLSKIEIPDSVTRIDSGVFRDCRSLKEINLPESITYLGSSVFYGCEKLRSLVIPPNVTVLNNYILAYCVVLSDVVIPAGVTQIEERSFYNSAYVRLHVTYGSAAEKYAVDHSLPYTYYLQQTKDFIYSRNDDGIQILMYIGNLFNVDIPSEIDGFAVTRINTAAFQNNSIAKRITVPISVTSIGDWAFSYMDSLESVTLPSRLKSLGADAFTGSSGLKSISIPKSVEEIGVEPFAGIEDIEIVADENSKAGILLLDMGYQIVPKAASDVNISAENSEEDVLPTSGTISDKLKTPESVSADIHTDVNVTSSAPEVSAQTTLTAETVAEFGNEDASVQTAVVTVPTDTPVPTNTPVPTETPSPTNTPVPTEVPTSTMTPTPTDIPVPVELKTTVKIPDGTVSVTVDMLENTAETLTLIIPESVTSIDDAIISGHELTIVSSINTEAERFARKWDLKFLIDLWYEGE